MRSTSTRSFAFALALSAFGPSLLVSQTPPAQRSSRPRAAAAPAPDGASGSMNAQSRLGNRLPGRGARDGRGGSHPASLLLRARTLLDLTDDQVKRLEALQAAPAPKSNATDMMRAQADLLDAMQGDGNLGGARTALDRLSRLRNDQLLARIKTRQDVRAVLTSAQKTTVDNMRQERRHGVGADHQRGMRQGDRGGSGFRGGPPMGGR